MSMSPPRSPTMKSLFAPLLVIGAALCFFIHKSNSTAHSLSHAAPISAQRTRGIFVPMRASFPELRRSLRICADSESGDRKPGCKHFKPSKIILQHVGLSRKGEYFRSYENLILGQPDKDGFVYADEVQKVERKKPKMSKEQMRRLRDEYVGVGGAQNTAMPNYFLYISILIAVLAITSKILGYLD